MSRWACAFGNNATVDIPGILWGPVETGEQRVGLRFPLNASKYGPAKHGNKKRPGRREAAEARVEALQTDSRQSAYLQNQVMCAR